MNILEFKETRVKFKSVIDGKEHDGLIVTEKGLPDAFNQMIKYVAEKAPLLEGESITITHVSMIKRKGKNVHEVFI